MDTLKRKKGDRVEWQSKGETKYGVVAKGGSRRIRVVLDGGDYAVSGPAGAFRLSDQPLPNADEPNPMSRYTITGRKDIDGHGDSATFVAVIRFCGKAVISVMNDGWGGPNDYRTLRKDAHHSQSEEMQDFSAKCRQWAIAADYEDAFEVEDAWVDWECFHRPYGVTAKAYLAPLGAGAE